MSGQGEKSAVVVSNLRRAYGERIVIDRLNLRIAHGEFAHCSAKADAVRPRCCGRLPASIRFRAGGSTRRAGPPWSFRSIDCCRGIRCGATCRSAWTVPACANVPRRRWPKSDSAIA